jgi:hypothetical protein
MTPSCPSCQAPFTPSAQTCGACGAPLLQPVSADGAEPACAVHPRFQSVGTCPRCGAFACARCVRQGPSGGVCATCLEREPLGELPWDQRGELGLFKAFWRTSTGILLRPTQTLQGVNPEASVGSSLGFILMCAVAGYLATGLLYTVLMGAIMTLVPQPTPPPTGINPRFMGLFMGLGMGIWAVVTPFLVAGLTLVNAGLDHLVLRMGGVERGFRVTLRAHALSMAPYLLGLIPFVAFYAAPFWSMGLRVFTYRTLHRTTWGPAVAAAIAVPVLSCCLCGGCYAAFVYALVNKFQAVPH